MRKLFVMLFVLAAIGVALGSMLLIGILEN